MAQTVKNLHAENLLVMIEPGYNLWIRKIPWRRKQQPTPVFLPGESQGQKSLVGYSPWGCKESDTTSRLSLSHTHAHTLYTYLCIRSS